MPGRAKTEGYPVYPVGRVPGGSRGAQVRVPWDPEVGSVLGRRISGGEQCNLCPQASNHVSGWGRSLPHSLRLSPTELALLAHCLAFVCLFVCLFVIK